MEKNKSLASEWFTILRNAICARFEEIEKTYINRIGKIPTLKTFPENSGKFTYKKWARQDGELKQNKDGGGGEMAIMYGNVFEKVGVNISTVYGTFSEQFRREIPGTEESANFWASGISLVAHMQNPYVPAIHMNTRFIVTTGKNWFGGGMDLTPTIEFPEDTNDFHNTLRLLCNRHDSSYYEKFSKQCDEYFFIKHRNEARGAGGIFYDYINSGDFNKDFNFTKDVGITFKEIFSKIAEKRMFSSWNENAKEKQLIKRGRYAEFNLLYDRGTKFGLMTGGNTEAILMSLPPVARWA